MFDLASLIFWLAAPLAIIIMGLITVSLIQAQRTHQDSPNAPENLHHRGWLELTWAIAPVMILLLLLVLTYQAMV